MRRCTRCRTRSSPGRWRASVGGAHWSISRARPTWPTTVNIWMMAARRSRQALPLDTTYDEFDCHERPLAGDEFCRVNYRFGSRLDTGSNELTVCNPSSKQMVPTCEWFAVWRWQRAAARPCWLSLARQKSQPKVSCQPEIWTRRVQDDGFGELGMEEKPVSIDPTVNKIEEAEDRSPDGLASGRPAKPGPGVETCKGPPCHNGVVASHYALDSDSQVTNVAAEAFDVRYQTGPTRWATERLVGLVHHVRVGQFLDQLQPTPGYNLLKIRPHQRLWLHLACSPLIARAAIAAPQAPGTVALDFAASSRHFCLQ